MITLHRRLGYICLLVAQIVQYGSHKVAGRLGETYEIHPGRNFVASMRHCMNQIADWLVIDDVQGVVIAVLSSGTLDLLAFACVTTVP